MSEDEVKIPLDFSEEFPLYPFNQAIARFMINHGLGWYRVFMVFIVAFVLLFAFPMCLGAFIWDLAKLIKDAFIEAGRHFPELFEAIGHAFTRDAYAEKHMGDAQHRASVVRRLRYRGPVQSS
jgi:hypothetical protein